MIIDSFGFDGHWINVHLNPVMVAKQLHYLVSTNFAGEGTPTPAAVKAMADVAERIPNEPNPLSSLRHHIRTAMVAGTWHDPVLILATEPLDIPTASIDPFTAGQEAFHGGMHYSANPHSENSLNNERWSEGWADQEKMHPEWFKEDDYLLK